MGMTWTLLARLGRDDQAVGMNLADHELAAGRLLARGEFDIPDGAAVARAGGACRCPVLDAQALADVHVLDQIFAALVQSLAEARRAQPDRAAQADRGGNDELQR